MSEVWRLENSIKQLDYCISQAVATIAKIEGMKAENSDRINNGLSLAYTEDDFVEVANRNGMNHNASIERQIK